MDDVRKTATSAGAAGMTEIQDPISCVVRGDTTGWWIHARSSKGQKKWGPYTLHDAMHIYKQLVRKWRAAGRMR